MREPEHSSVLLKLLAIYKGNLDSLVVFLGSGRSCAPFCTSVKVFGKFTEH